MPIPSESAAPTPSEAGASVANSTERVQARARLYAFLAAVLHAPDPSSAAKIAAEAVWQEVRQAARTLGDANVGAAVERAWERRLTGGLAALRTAHGQVFGHGLRGPAPPYECEYGDSEIFRLSGELADIAGFYAAFGVQIDREAQERPDHVAAELEFMLFLCAKQASAMEEGGREGLEHCAVVRDAQRKFLRDHLGRWGSAFGRRMDAADAQGFFGAVGKWLEAFLVSECARLSVRPGPALLALRPAGTAEELIAAQACGTAPGIPGALPPREPDAEPGREA